MATVLLTGASGFVGLHTLCSLLDDGHRIRALVRDPRRLSAHMGLVGLAAEDDRVDVAAGDMTDEGAVEAAVDGCDAVVHAAATFSLRRRDRDLMRRQNEVGTRVVLTAGAEAGCGRLVHVSSTVALHRPGGATLDHESPLGRANGPYSATKIASEQVARELQERGAPVTIVNPGSVIGPADPYLGESNANLVDVLRGRIPAWPRGLQNYVDVRDVAATLAAALHHDAGGRYLVPGTTLPGPHRVLADVTGRRLVVPTLSARLVAAAATPGYVTGWSFLPGTVEGVRQMGCANPIDASATTEHLGVSARPVQESMRDTVRWLAAAGHISRKQAGRALE